MDENKTLLKIALGVLVALAVIAALWRVLAYEPGHAAPQAVPARTSAQARAPQAAPFVPVTEQDSLRELLPEEEMQNRAAKKTTQAPVFAGSSSRPAAYPKDRASRKVPYRRRSASAQRYADTDFDNSSQEKLPYAQAAASFYNPGGKTAAQPVSAATRMQEERAHMLAPYLRPNRKQKEQMDAKWAQLSAAIDRAVLQALTPKSKKEQMLEKYAPKADGTSAAQANGPSGPFAPVVSAIAAQKNDIVKSFGQAFGTSAAREAGSLMDSFTSEVAAATGAPGVSSQQAAQQVKAIAKKYEKKMDQLAEKSQYDKFVADRVAQDNKQKEELGALYPEQKVQIGQLIDQTREKDLALATQDLPREEYFNQLAQNNQALRSGIQKLVAQNGKSVQDFQKWEQAQTQAYLEKLGQLEEQGQIQSVAHTATADDRRRTQADIKANKQRLENDIKSTLGEQALTDFEPIFDNYERALKQLDEAKISPVERETQRANITQEANRQLIDQKIRYVEKMNIPDDQKQAVLENLRQAYNNFK